VCAHVNPASCSNCQNTCAAALATMQCAPLRIA
jgi:hypothetical protein